MLDYRSWLKTVRRATPWTVNAHLTALDHFYAHHLGLGAPVVKRERITASAQESLAEVEQRRFIRACRRCGSTRNAAIGLLILYTGLRVEEVEALDVDDVVTSAAGQGHRPRRQGRRVPGGPAPPRRPRRAVGPGWTNAPSIAALATPARCCCCCRGAGSRCGYGRFATSWPSSARTPASCTTPTTPRWASLGSIRTPCATPSATQLLRNDVDIVIVADLMGHATLDTTRCYTRSSETDRARAIEDALISDE